VYVVVFHGAQRIAYVAVLEPVKENSQKYLSRPSVKRWERQSSIDLVRGRGVLRPLKLLSRKGAPLYKGARSPHAAQLCRSAQHVYRWSP